VPRGLFERLLGLRNDVGLLAEEYDPVLELPRGPHPWGNRFQGRDAARSARQPLDIGYRRYHYANSI
jgi:hypothetical protein